MSKRSQQIRAEKERCVALGHEMGNAVNCSPIGTAKWTVRCTCRKCGAHLFVNESPEGIIVATGNALALALQECPEKSVVVKVTDNRYDPEFIARMDRILAFVADGKSEHVEAFPASVNSAYGNDCGDGVLAAFATEMVEGSESEGEISDEATLANRCVVLMERVREDLDFIIDRLMDCADAAAKKETPTG